MDESTSSELLRLARRSIESSFAGTDIAELDPGTGHVLLGESRGTFVTLKKGPNLRGCIGQIESELPLWQTVARMAREAAFSDPRFEALTSAELDSVSIEVSVLTPVEEIDDPETVEVGRHGLIVENGYNRGLLLPQVPVEWGWDRYTFLEQTCKKAGLPASAWRDPATRLFVFSAEVVSEVE